MAQEFVRNIKNAKIRGERKEPLNTNIQNDILSDNEDIAIRHKDDYFILTDSIKKITSKNKNLDINIIDKNTLELDVKNQGGGGGGEVEIDIFKDYKMQFIINKVNETTLRLRGSILGNEKMDNLKWLAISVPEPTITQGGSGFKYPFIHAYYFDVEYVDTVNSEGQSDYNDYKFFTMIDSTYNNSGGNTAMKYINNGLTSISGSLAYVLDDNTYIYHETGKVVSIALVDGEIDL